ncbi:MAG: sigma-54 interaction domain-containing protein [Bacilli bacterium]
MTEQANEHAWLTAVLSGVDVGVHAVDTRGVTVYYNHNAGRLDGLQPSEVTGRHLLAVFPSLSEETSSLLRVLRSEETISHRRQSYTNYRGDEVHTANTTRPVYAGGRLIGALEIAADMTEMKHLAERVVDLQAARLPSAGVRNVRGGSGVVWSLADLLTVTPEVLRVVEMAKKVAATSSPVLVYGETGTGKELLVQGIHGASARAGNAFIAQNCAALPGALLEGILFGTVKGSFTGAENRQGLFELAHGGTLFLDELNSMPPDLQTKLLRVLEDQQVRRLGDNKAIPVDVRIVAAMNSDPEEAVRTGQLRADLYYRVRVAALRLPPLADRPTDIPLLIDHFLALYNERFGKFVRALTADAMDILLHATWRGNVRELKHAIEAAMIVVEDELIERQHLPAYLLRDHRSVAVHPVAEQPQTAAAGAVADTIADTGAKDGAATLSLSARLAQSERLWIQEALSKSGGRIAKAAASLGIPRQTLQSKMKKYEL